ASVVDIGRLLVGSSESNLRSANQHVQSKRENLVIDRSVHSVTTPCSGDRLVAMDVPRLEAFLEVARLGSMRSASRTLHLGQPAIRARIATLEDEVGARLFERTKRGVRLTLAGRALLPHAERALDAIDA